MMISAQELPAVSLHLRRFVDTYLLARAAAEAERERMDALDRGILLRDDGSPIYRVAEEWLERGRAPEFITDPRHTYLMSDEDAEDYFAERQHRLRKAGYKLPDGHCPALVAEDLQRQAEKALILAASEYFGIDEGQLYGEHRRKYIDLLTGIVVNHPTYTKPKLR